MSDHELAAAEDRAEAAESRAELAEAALRQAVKELSVIGQLRVVGFGDQLQLVAKTLGTAVSTARAALAAPSAARAAAEARVLSTAPAFRYWLYADLTASNFDDERPRQFVAAVDGLRALAAKEQL